MRTQPALSSSTASSAPHHRLPGRTGPLEDLAGSNLLVLADVENLSIAARERGYHVAYDQLSVILAEKAASSRFHAFFSRRPGDTTDADFFRKSGWSAHPRDIRMVRGPQGLRKSANSDLILAVWAGALLRSSRFDTLLIATGDGELGCEIAAAAREIIGEEPLIGTLAVAGSMSRRLSVATNDDLDFNVLLGRDCMLDLHQERAIP